MILPVSKTPAAVAVMSSHVARGAVGNRAAVFALETLGHAVTAVPTVLLPWHPGHGRATRIVPEAQAFDRFLTDLAAGPFASEIGAVLTGYLGAASQAQAIATAIGRLRAANPDLIHVCDPVIGDEGGLYVPQDVAEAIAGQLVPICDVCTPNRFELAWLAGQGVTDQASMITAARALDPGQVIVTSAPAARKGVTGNALITPHRTVVAWHTLFDAVPSGTGDLTAALYLGHRLAGADGAVALQRATGSVIDMIRRTRQRGANELTLAADAQLLREPETQPVLEEVLEPVAR